MSTNMERGQVGLTLRAFTGVDEAVLDTVPSERPRYTAMGGVVLGTAVIAMFSMTVALYLVFDGFHPVVMLFVPVWGLFILFIDRWLMSSTASDRGSARFRKMIPRLLMAMIFGVIIAEPLLLGVFHTAIDQRIRDDRDVELRTRESNLKRCNPVPGTPEAGSGVTGAPECKGLRLAVTTDSEAKQSELVSLQKQRDKLKTDTAAESKEYARLDDVARLECNGTDGPGNTGLVGVGPNCIRNRAKADQYRDDHRIDENNARLGTLDQQIEKLNQAVGSSRADAATRIDKGIADAVAEYRRNQRPDIGLLERLGALGKLVKENGHMHAAEWALRIFFIAVDSLPVLLKFLNGYSAYDRVVADRVNRQRSAQKVVAETVRRETVIREELERYRINAEHQAARTRIEFDARVRNIDAEVARETLTDARAEHFLHDTPTVPIAVPRGFGRDFDDTEGR